MYLGVSGYSHESAVALVDATGRLIDYCKEETLSRIKGDKSFPKRALKKIFVDNQLRSVDIQAISLHEKPLTAFLTPLNVASRYLPQSLPLVAHQLKNFKRSSIVFYSDILRFDADLASKIIYSDHHLSHTLNGLAYASKRDQVCSIVVDGFGDRSSASIALVQISGSIQELWRLPYPASLGLFYSAITDYLGFAINEGEYKVMGLASFGAKQTSDNPYIDKLRTIIGWDHQSKTIHCDMHYFSYHTSTSHSYSKELVQLLGVERNPFEQLTPESPQFQRYADIAAAAQTVLTELLQQLFAHAHELSGSHDFIFSGGVAMNSACLKTLAALPFVNSITVPASPGDAGSAIGAALYGAIVRGTATIDQISRPSFFPMRYTRVVTDGKQCSSILSNDFEQLSADPSEALERTADLITAGEVVATLIGAAETGPRALGHRSLICNGESQQAVQQLNRLIKKRSPFRPTAPACKPAIAASLYQLAPELSSCYLSMSATCDVPATSRAAEFPTTHIDGTARLQIVEPDTLLFNLLTALEPRGIQVIANSSLNLSGDPTCGDLFDALMVCYRSDLKYLLTDSGLFQFKG